MRRQHNPVRAAQQSCCDGLEIEFRANVEHLCRLGPRAVAEFLAELGAVFLDCTEIETGLRRYRRLDPEKVTLVGGRRWQ
jgi:hypothetical protein